MEITFAPRGILQIDGAYIIYRNFSGEASKFNREGDRNFAVIIPTEEMANELISHGWNVKIKPARDPDGNPDPDGDMFMYLPVKVKFNDRGPVCYLETGRKVNQLSEASIGILDDVDILEVSLDIRPYDWDVNGKVGRTAYLQSINVVQKLDRFAERHNEMMENTYHD